MKHSSSQESGNVLFLILIAVVLFAALSLAFTYSTHTTENTAGKETDLVQSGVIVQYGAALENALVRLRTSKGCADTELSFENSILAGYTNPDAPANKRCHIFDPAGAGEVVGRVDPKWVTNPASVWKFTGANCIPDIGTGSSSCDSPANPAMVDLIAVLPNLRRDLCKQINDRFGVANNAPDGGPPVDADATWSAAPFTGTYTATSKIANAAGTLNGQRDFCFGDGSTFTYVHVLLAR